MQFLIETPSSPPRSPRDLHYHHNQQQQYQQQQQQQSSLGQFTRQPLSLQFPLGTGTSNTMLPSTAAAATGVSFGALPGQASSQPGALSYGFGLGAASSFGLPPPPQQQQPPPAPQPPPPHQAQSSANGPASASPSASGSGWGWPATPTARRRRRRSLSPEDDSDQQQQNDQHDTGNQYTDKSKQIRGMKKARVCGAGATSGAGSESSSLAASLREQQDLGKALASLDKESLLGIMTNLLTSHPQLRSVVQGLLPPPTLSNTLATLANLERAVIAALPSGAHLREEYIWGRVRVPLEEYVSEAKSFLSIFTTTPAASSSSSPTGEDEIGHPSTTFAFLHALTSSLRRLEVALPATNSPPSTPGGHGSWPTMGSTHGHLLNPLASHLLPLTLNSWHIFLTKLSTAVNTEGRIISAQTLRGWFARLDELCVASPTTGPGRKEGLAKRAMEGVRERMRKEVGWLVGMREPVVREPSVMDDDEEEL